MMKAVIFKFFIYVIVINGIQKGVKGFYDDQEDDDSADELLESLNPALLRTYIGYGATNKEWMGEMEQLSWAPRAFHYKKFLTDEECDYLIKKAKPSMMKSLVVDNDTGESIESDFRTSSGAFLLSEGDDILQEIERRVSFITMLPIEHQEEMHILHYSNDEYYQPHYDFFHDDVNSRKENGGQRIMTVLMYLSDVEEGGETVFPNTYTGENSFDWNKCAYKSLTIKPVKGDALMFYGLLPNGDQDKMSLHASCPILKGNKWSATKWIRANPISYYLKRHKIKCKDNMVECASWASIGECSKNPAFMLHHCKNSCNQCSTRT